MSPPAHGMSPALFGPHGGTKKVDRDISVYIDNVVIAKKYIGPMR